MDSRNGREGGASDDTDSNDGATGGELEGIISSHAGEGHDESAESPEGGVGDDEGDGVNLAPRAGLLPSTVLADTTSVIGNAKGTVNAGDLMASARAMGGNVVARKLPASSTVGNSFESEKVFPTAAGATRDGIPPTADDAISVVIRAPRRLSSFPVPRLDDSEDAASDGSSTSDNNMGTYGAHNREGMEDAIPRAREDGSGSLANYPGARTKKEDTDRTGRGNGDRLGEQVGGAARGGGRSMWRGLLEVNVPCKGTGRQAV